MKKLFRKIFRKWIQEENHNLKVSANIGLLIIDKLANDRAFRRKLTQHFPSLSNDIDRQVRQIK